MSLAEFFSTFKDGAWHSIDQLADRLGLSTSKLIQLSKLLSDHGLLEYESKARRVRLKPLWKLRLPKETEPPKPKTTVATFIIPPKTSIDVQSTHISNLSNTELEVSLRINNKINEVAIKI